MQTIIKRRKFLFGSVALIGSCARYSGSNEKVAQIPSMAKQMQVPSAPPMPEHTALLDDLQKRTFDFFWETTNPMTGLTPDRWPAPSASSIAGVGFGFVVLTIGVNRGYIKREQAAQRTLTTLRFLWSLKQGPEPRGNGGYKGFFYHFLDTKTGARLAECELSTIDTSLLVAGALFAADYFNLENNAETEIRDLVKRIYERIDWKWAQYDGRRISMGWHPETQSLIKDKTGQWNGYNEGMIVYILALGSPTFPVAPDAWAAWCETYPEHWGSYAGYEHLIFPPHFGHQYSHIFVDFRGIKDEYMRQKGIDYFENSRRATYAQRAYGYLNPLQYKGYSENIWGITACDGPYNGKLPFKGRQQQFVTYSGRGAAIWGAKDTYDDGTIAPTGAIASMPFAPEIVIPSMVEMHRIYGAQIYQKYGFVDAFNPSFEYDVPTPDGKVIKDFGWVASNYLAIDQGPIIIGIENYRNDFVGKFARNNAIIRRGLIRAGFSGGYLG